MKRTEAVIAILKADSPLTSREIADRCGCDIKQTRQALVQAASRGLCHFVDDGAGPTGTSGWWHYGPADGTVPEEDWDAEAPRGQYGIPRVSSVWQYAQGLQVVSRPAA
jgi:hypothetical protein